MLVWVSLTIAALIGLPQRFAWTIKETNEAKVFPSPVLLMRAFTTASENTNSSWVWESSNSSLIRFILIDMMYFDSNTCQ
jgi:hypothetical protein